MQQKVGLVLYLFGKCLKKKMIRTILIFLVALFSMPYSCKNNRRHTNNNNLQDAYVYDFKIRYFKQLLLEGFNQSQAIKEVLNEDASKGLSDSQLSLQDIEIINRYAQIGNTEMVKNSMYDSTMAEGSQGKYVFSFALEKFNSKWLDSLSKARYNIFKKK